MSSRKRTKKETPKKKCNTCGRDRAYTFYFKVDSHLFPDGMINTCRDCVRESVDVDDLEQVISFLRQIDKPFIDSYWNEALQTNRHPLGEYIRKINSLQQLKGKTFDDSKGIGIGTSSDVLSSQAPDTVKSEQGKEIEYSDSFITKWGIGYKKHEYLKMEKFYQDMSDTHDIQTPIHRDMLIQLAKLAVKRDRYIEQDNMNDYEKANRAFEATMKSAGFRPVDRKGGDEQAGIRTFSQIWEEVERRGFRKPPKLEFDEDIIDGQIIALANYYHRLIGRQIVQEIPDEIKEEMDEFFKDDLTPVDINDEEYEDLDFSFDDEDDGNTV